jgi:DNA-binding CsgD family transcriptional regulator
VSSVTGGLPPFLHFLGSFPEPASVARALVTGPLAPLDARTCIIMLAHEDVELRCISTHGFIDAVDDRYRTISLRLDMSIVIAYREGRTIATGLQGFSETHAALSLDKPVWDELLAVLGPGTVIDAPIVSEGTPLGSVGLVCAERGEWDATDFALVDGVCSALGLWITHPRSRVELKLRAWETHGDERLDLTERQRRILQMVELGKSNAAIAATLGYSESTVKQEVLRVMRVLRATDRHDAVRRARDIGLLA